ncbi:DUF6304 family protein [Hymenobacter sp. ASUV-10]|uniref:DUF6304 family protein n=1 Tax=Hymenobacter aranciens TaxID=3063996 RepID=A0ABT9BEQ1_9BACT|nr:DUF6304 family protein [Hymenobacter sp. ASUV-10]MDO7876740.1 DUF6304 family protein [Hymenobacter sp. ASUV-10]
MTIKYATYNAYYTDSTGRIAVIIKNDFQLLSVEIEGVKFEGYGFNNLSIIDKPSYSQEQLQRFTLLPIQVSNPDDNTTYIDEELSNFSLEFVIPQLVIDVVTSHAFSADLLMNYSLNSTDESFVITLPLAGVVYTGRGGWIETAFDQIHNQFAGKYRFKNCYGCIYGDYSVYGNDSFGTMLCFANQKQEYRATSDKAGYMDLAPPRGAVQEIYCCSDYEIRRKGVGYRD